MNFPLRNTSIQADNNARHESTMKAFFVSRLFNLRQQYIRRQTGVHKDHDTIKDLEFAAHTEPRKENERCYQCGVGDNLVQLRPCTKCPTEWKNLRPLFCGINCQENFRETVHATPHGTCHKTMVKLIYTKRVPTGPHDIATLQPAYPGCEGLNDPALWERNWLKDDIQRIARAAQV